MFGSILPLMRMAGFGRKKRRGGRKMLIQGSGRRKMRGRGIFDTIKNIGKKAFNIARSVPIISTGLNLAGKKDWADAAKSVGFGRRRVGTRRTRRRRYGGRMSVYGGRRRRYRRRTCRGGRRRATKRRFSVFGGRKRKMRGGLLSSLVRGLLGGRRKRHTRRRRRVGGRKRTYRVGLFSRRR